MLSTLSLLLSLHSISGFVYEVLSEFELTLGKTASPQLRFKQNNQISLHSWHYFHGNYPVKFFMSLKTCFPSTHLFFSNVLEATSSYTVNCEASGWTNPWTRGSYVATQRHTRINTDGNMSENRGRIGEQECNKWGKRKGVKKKKEGMARGEGKSCRRRQGSQRGRKCLCDPATAWYIDWQCFIHFNL